MLSFIEELKNHRYIKLHELKLEELNVHTDDFF